MDVKQFRQKLWTLAMRKSQKFACCTTLTSSKVSSPPPEHVIREGRLTLSCLTSTLAKVVVLPSRCFVKKWHCEGKWVTVAVGLTPRSTFVEEWMRELVNSLLQDPSGTVYCNFQLAQHINIVVRFTCWHSDVYPCEWSDRVTPHGHTYVLGAQSTVLAGGNQYVLAVDTGELPFDQWVIDKFRNGFTFYYRTTTPPSDRRRR